MGLQDEIKDAVNWQTQSVSTDDSMRIAAEKMVAGGNSALAVKVGEEVVGVLTDMDLMECIDRNEDLEATKACKCMTSCELITAKGTKSPCAQLDASQSVANAIGVMNIAGVHHLLVTGEDERSIGLVSSIDLLRLAIA